MNKSAREDLRRILAETPDKKGGGAVLLSSHAGLAGRLGASAESGGALLDLDVAGYCETPRVQRRFSVGIVVCAMADMAAAAFEHLISRLRDLDCERVYLYREGGASVEDDNFVRALGLRLLQTYPGEDDGGPGGRLYYFDIFDYKDAPDWLNSRFWANPRMWDKARW